MASSFAGINIRVARDSATGAAPDWDQASNVSVRPIPGSNTEVIQVLGTGHDVMTVNMQVDPEDWAAFKPLLATEGTLIIASVSHGTCLLESRSGLIRYVNGVREMQATFRKVAP